MDLTAAIQTYLVVHGLSTVGAIVIFLVRNEHRITKLETSFNNLEKTHDWLTNYGTNPH